MGRYRIGMACLNGHPINAHADVHWEFNSKFCGECGVATITACMSCNAYIRGEYYIDGVFSAGPAWAPARYCYDCGKPYPWTEAALNMAATLIDDSTVLNADEKERLKSTLQDLTTDTAKTPVALQRFKALAAKAGTAVSDGLVKVMTNVATEAVKKGLGL